VKADPVLVHHILINLLANAAIHGGAGPIEIIGERSPDAITLSIRDHGPGLPLGREARIFETFTRGSGDDRTGGSGLGLAIAKGFADAMKLRLSATQAPGGGACFSLRFTAMERAAGDGME
jgi:two-component system, OmpR family, sensor histidine kinase KdpD